jgi:NADH dehydrogenase
MILVIGGTGTVGSKIVENLLDAGQPIRVYSRGQGDWRNNVGPQFRKAGVEVISGDVCDADRVAAAIKGCTGIIYCAGIMQAEPAHSLYEVNVEALQRILPLAEAEGVQRLIYLGCLGSTQFSHCEYLRTKWEAEQLVRQSKFYWTIFRPAPIFGIGSHLTRSLEFWANKFPVIPVVGSGLNELRPVSVHDVVSCVINALYNKETVWVSYDLVGPEVFTLTELMEFTRAEYELDRKPMINLPASVGFALAKILARIYPRMPVSADFLKYLMSDLSGDPALMKSQLGAPMLPLESQFKRLAAPRS